MEEISYKLDSFECLPLPNTHSSDSLSFYSLITGGNRKESVQNCIARLGLLKARSAVPKL